MLEILIQYYGLDWLDALMSMFGIYFLSRKKRVGFLLNAIGSVSGLVLFIYLESYPFIALNIVLIYLNMVGYQKWKMAE